ncbi:MAG: HAD hydrolase family protein [Verrucomicrobiota bacterium]|jgi:phosphoserine phosphatase
MSRKIKLVSIDGDGCLFAYTKIGSAFHSSWDAVAFAYGLKETWDARAKKYIGRQTECELWAQEDAADLRGRLVSMAATTLYPIPYCNGAREFLQASQGRLVRGLLSGCLDIVGKRAAAETELDFCFCNKMHEDAGVFSGTMDYAVPVWHKHLFIAELCKTYQIVPEEICHVGDHENDLGCFECVGLAVAFNPKKEEVGRKAKHVISDFRELNRILDLA